nr:hypothetical protein [Kofleriaceae bacterium]
MADDDAEVMQRLAALEAEVKADADAQSVRKAAALTKLREQRAAKDAEAAVERERQLAVVAKKKPAAAARAAAAHDDDDDDDEDGGLRGAIELANKANKVKKELSRKGGKSWVKSGVASLALGPIGWLYAGSFREAIPATAVWLVIATILSKLALPSLILMPALLITLPLSAIAGIVYAVQFNKTGKRQRLFGDDKKKQLPPAAK